MDMGEFPLEEAYEVDDIFGLPHYGPTAEQIKMDSMKDDFIGVLTSKLAEKGMKLERMDLQQ